MRTLFKKPLVRAIQVAAATAALMAAPGVSAQDTTSALRGVVTAEGGQALAGATVVIRDENTGRTKTVTTDSTGGFSLRNLPIGSDFTVTVTREGYAGKRTEDLVLNLGKTSDLNFILSPSTSMEEVVVVASQNVTSYVALGPSATFGLETLETSPAINRNISDVLRTDPRIYVDESRGGINAVQCGGKNSRYNSLTVDGVRMNDSFGLNDNGYPTERMPFSYDAINEVAVELAPFDVEYGGFTACNINAVTKSGANEFYGSVFFDYTDDSLKGDSLEGDDIENSDFTEQRFGFNVGGPIIQDKLFFFVAYEMLEGANLFERGPIGSGAVNEIEVTQAELDEIANIARTLYQYEPGPAPTSLDNEDEKLLVKLDWNINDNHRAAFTYNYNDGNNFTESDGDLDEFEFENHLYERGAELNSYQATWYANWTDQLSTEFRVGYLELDNRQISVGGTDFGEIRVELDDVDVYLGGDDSRQSNKLTYDNTNVAFKANYEWGDHTFTVGVEREALEVFNLFVQHTETEIRFEGIDNFRDGFADAIYYNNAPSNNPNDAAADWGYEFNTVYGQDEFIVNDQLTLVFGLRYDWYTSDDSPEENPDFVADYGFSNSTNLDEEGLLQPRFGFTYDYSDALSLRGGLGLYTGGNPNVWLSNNFSANNVLQFGQRGRSFGYTDGSRSLFDDDVVYAALEPGVPAGPGYGIPQELFDAVAAGTGDNFEINYLDRNFDLPSEWKLAIGGTYITESEYVFMADLLWTRGKDSAIILHGDLEQVGTTEEGYPQYESVREPTFVLTNSSKGSRSFLASFSVAKAYDNGIDWNAGYSYSDALDVQPMNSAVAFSNYQNRAFFDPQEEVLSTSSYNIEHRFTFSVNYKQAFWDDNMTKISLFGQAHQGPSYSYAFNGTIDPYGFTPFLDFRNNVLAPGDERNDQRGSWWGKLDLKVEQEIPVNDTSKASAYIIVDNLTNLLNDEWGVMRQVDFPGNVERGDQAESRIGEASQFQIRFGLSYDF